MIGIIGFGRFGRLAARHLAKDFKVYVASREPVPEKAVKACGCRLAGLDVACRQKIVILCVPISAMEQVLESIADRLEPGALVVDVCSVKQYPVKWMKNLLPTHTRILATHPMFGPDSVTAGLDGHKIVLWPVRLSAGRYRRIRRWLEVTGLRVIEADPDEHDRSIAISLALTHFIGRALAEFGARQLSIDTEGYKRLLHILEVVENDTWQLFYDMNHYNPHADACRQAFMLALEKVETKLKDTCLQGEFSRVKTQPE